MNDGGKDSDFEVLSQKHERLLNIADAAKYAAWLVLGAFVLDALLQVPLQVAARLQEAAMLMQPPPDTLAAFTKDVAATVRLIAAVLTTTLRGVVFYLVLKGTSLGLRMIVETDVNYRLQRSGKGGQ